MSYCSKCGSELDPNSSFCVSCGTPVAGSAASAPGPQPPMAPQAPYAQPGGYAPPPKGKGGKIALVTILVLILIGAAVVLVLGFAVGPKWFVSSNSSSNNTNNDTGDTNASTPEKTVNAMLRAMENKDAKAFLATLSPSSLSILESQVSGSGVDLASTLSAFLFTYQSMSFSGVKYNTQVTGDTATVSVVEGTVTTVDQNGDKTTEDVKDSSEPMNVNLTKENGTWYINFEQTFQSSP